MQKQTITALALKQACNDYIHVKIARGNKQFFSCARALTNIRILFGCPRAKDLYPNEFKEYAKHSNICRIISLFNRDVYIKYRHESSSHYLDHATLV